MPLQFARLPFRLHMCVDCMCVLLSVVCLCVRLCLYARFACGCVTYAAVSCKVALRITCVCILHVCFVFMMVGCLFAIVCAFCV